MSGLVGTSGSGVGKTELFRKGKAGCRNKELKGRRKMDYEFNSPTAESKGFLYIY